MGLNLTYVTRGGLTAVNAYVRIEPQMSVTKTTTAFRLLAYVSKAVSDAEGPLIEDPRHFEAPYDLAGANPMVQGYDYLKDYDPTVEVQAGIDAAQAQIDAIDAAWVEIGEEPDEAAQADLQTLADRKASFESMLAAAQAERDRWAAATDA